jgi:hypothetical protein
MRLASFTAEKSLYKTRIQYQLLTANLTLLNATDAGWTEVAIIPAQETCTPNPCTDTHGHIVGECCHDSQGNFRGCCGGNCCYDQTGNATACAGPGYICCGGGTCVSENLCCNDACTPQSESNCGACGNTCGTDQICEDDRCVCRTGSTCGKNCCGAGEHCCWESCCAPGESCCSGPLFGTERVHRCCPTGTLCDWSTGRCESAPLGSQGQGDGKTIAEACKNAMDNCKSNLKCRFPVTDSKCDCWRSGFLGFTCIVQCRCNEPIV